MLQPIKQYETIASTNGNKSNKMCKKNVQIHLDWINNQIQGNQLGDDHHRSLLCQKNINRKLMLTRNSHRNKVVMLDENMNNENICKIGKLEGIKKQSLDRKQSMMIRQNMNRKRSLKSQENLKVIDKRRDSCQVLIITPKNKGKLSMQTGQNVKLKPIQNRILFARKKVSDMINQCSNYQNAVLSPWQLYQQKQANGEVDIVNYKIL